MTTTFVPVPGGRLHAVDEGSPADPAIVFPERVVAVVGVGAGLGGFEGVEFLAPLPRWS